MEFRLLRADEIECRVATVSEKGVSLLLYKDARCDMNILDETVGPERWQRHHELIDGQLFCNVGIRFDRKDGFGEWVWKQDVGTESYTEKEKGRASDSFKRSSFNWGIGRELYSAPFIWVPANKCQIVTGKNGKPTCYDRFYVEVIRYDERKRICELSIANEKTKRGVYYYGEAPKQGKSVKDAQWSTLEKMCKRAGVDFAALVAKDGYSKGAAPAEWVTKQIERINNYLESKK